MHRTNKTVSSPNNINRLMYHPLFIAYLVMYTNKLTPISLTEEEKIDVKMSYINKTIW
jgi:hypothetical protein